MPTPQASSHTALPAHVIERMPLRAASRFLQWLIMAILAICLPLQVVSTSVTALLGARHTHREPVVARVATGDTQDPLREWREWQMQAGEAQGSSHERAHALGIRHHHLLGDPSVIHDDASDFADHAFSSDTVQVSASFLFMPASGSADLPSPTEAFGLPWRALSAVSSGNPDPWRIERPPQALLA